MPVSFYICELGDSCMDCPILYPEEDDCCHAVEVRHLEHGRWNMYSSTMQECSVCKKHTARHRYNYCPQCGARMDLEVDGDG